MFRFFETRIDVTGEPEVLTPPNTLPAFYWHFVRQAKGVVFMVLGIGLVTGFLDILTPIFFGLIVDILASTTPERLLADHGWSFAAMALIILVIRPAIHCLHNMSIDQALVPTFTNLIRWQLHRFVLRHSWEYFQNDFAGRIANKVVQCGHALRGSVTSMIGSIWYVTVYAVTTLVWLISTDPLLSVPVLVWFAFYLAVLWIWVPPIKRRSAIMSEARSALSGRIVDSYTNILTVKLFARKRHEDAYVRDSIDFHTERFRELMRHITVMNSLHWVINAGLMAGTATVAVYLWHDGRMTPGDVAAALPLVFQVANMSGWIMDEVTNLFENFGTVEESMVTITQPQTVIDRPDAKGLEVSQGALTFDNVVFHYGKEKGVIDRLSLYIAPGEKIGLVGRSGAGKSTLVNLLLRFHDLEGGHILIDGQDIAGVTQDSLRSQIAMVTQDTSLLHRSIFDNIRYGRPDASIEDVIEAAKKAQAHDFIGDLVDGAGRRGYDTHVGERGVKLSGGQRQRVAIARVILKDAPILILDEATSALDSEVESAIQDSLVDLMHGKTVIAIAHRLSTIARMDRLVVLDNGRIVDTGTHAELLARDGEYAMLWKKQSGGFLSTG